VRRPSYCTEGVYGFEKTHRAAVKEVLPLFRYVEGEGSRGAVVSDEGMAFQIASIDEVGHVQLWVPYLLYLCSVC
jgi:hypothetical protein